MDSFTGLRAARIDTIEAGKFVLFIYQDKSHFGLTVLNKIRGAPPDIVCLSGQPLDPSKVGLLGTSQIHAIFEITHAKLIATLDLASVVPAREKYSPAGALIQHNDKIGIRAWHGGDVVETFDVKTGEPLSESWHVYFPAWSLVGPNHEGGWRTIYEFKLAN